MTMPLLHGTIEKWVAGLAVLVVAALFIPAGGGLRAQEQPAQTRPITVGVNVSPPFVIEKDGRLAGMAIELWEAVAGNLGLRSEYRRYKNVRDLVAATERGEVEAAVTNLTITQDRARRIDFTHPWYDAGLRIMVNKEAGTGFWSVVEGLRDAGHLRAYA